MEKPKRFFFGDLGVSKIGVPQNGWFIMANPIKMDDLGGSTIFGNSHLLGMTSYPPCLGIMFFRKNIRIPIKLNNQFFWKVRPGVLFFVAHVYICMCVPVRVCIHIYI